VGSVDSGGASQKALVKNQPRAKVGKSVLDLRFLSAASRKPDCRQLRRCCGVKSERHDSLPPSPEGCLKRAKQRANGARLRATPTDSRRQSPQVDGSPGDVRRRRNTQKYGLHPEGQGVRVPLAPHIFNTCLLCTAPSGAPAPAAGPRYRPPRGHGPGHRGRSAWAAARSPPAGPAGTASVG
jgi:hypothetical protein